MPIITVVASSGAKEEKWKGDFSVFIIRYGFEDVNVLLFPTKIKKKKIYIPKKILKVLKPLSCLLFANKAPLEDPTRIS